MFCVNNNILSKKNANDYLTHTSKIQERNKLTKIEINGIIKGGLLEKYR